MLRRCNSENNEPNGRSNLRTFAWATCSCSAMSGGGLHVKYTDVIDALEDGLDLATVQQLLQLGMKQETEEEMSQAREVLSVAMESDQEMFEAVLDAMSEEAILPTREEPTSALYDALTYGSKEKVMAVVERMKKDGSSLCCTWSIQAVLYCDLSRDEEVMRGVIDVINPAAFGPNAAGPRGYDILFDALGVEGKQAERLVELCLRFGPPMEERIEKWRSRFRYVNVAAQYTGYDMMVRIYDLVPFLPDGSARRGDDGDYAQAISRAALNRREGTDVSAMMEFLLEEAGGDVDLLKRHPTTMLMVPTKEDLEWLVTRAPSLLEAACRDEQCLRTLLKCNTRTHVIELMVNLVDREVLKDLAACSINKHERKERRGEGWRWMLDELYKTVPEFVDGQKWQWLMEAIHDKSYRDVEYMLTMCTREHLVKEYAKGDRAWDVASRDKKFPPELLARLKAVTKGAHE